MTKQAVILAAGRGLRLGGEVNGNPKCLIPFGGKTLLEHQLDVLQSHGIERCVVVVGHEADRVRSVVSGGHVCIANQRYDETNSLYSLWLARHHVTGPFLLLNGDVLAHPDVYRRLLSMRTTALTYDSSSGTEAEHMKVSFRNGLLRAISKTLGADDTDGENVGILHFDQEAANLLFKEADHEIASGELKSWAPVAVDRMTDRVKILGVDVADLPWTEIDFPEDLVFAREIIWPAIDRRGSREDRDNSAAAVLWSPSLPEAPVVEKPPQGSAE
ncbi:MAG: phosphocholine cytidylyltransferase family protein [Planctomycetes bacterium]|nr:phosphocholine cytidylyltransferase family protein [Planctomycetota bacterium]